MNKETIINFIKKYAMIFVMNVVTFIILFFLIPLLFTKVNPILWRILFILTIIVVTDLFYLIKKISFKYEQVLCSLPILFILNIIFLTHCKQYDLYGIASHGGLDKSPAFLDALLVDIIIVFIQYVTLFITRFIVKMFKKESIKEDNKIEKTKEVKKTAKKTTTRKTTKK